MSREDLLRAICRAGHDSALPAITETPGLVGLDEGDAVEDGQRGVGAVGPAGRIDGHGRFEPALAHGVDMVDLSASGHSL